MVTGGAVTVTAGAVTVTGGAVTVTGAGGVLQALKMTILASISIPITINSFFVIIYSFSKNCHNPVKPW